MSIEVQPTFNLEAPRYGGDTKVQEIPLDEYLAFCALEKQGLVRVIYIEVKDHKVDKPAHYKVAYLERI